MKNIKYIVATKKDDIISAEASHPVRLKGAY